MNRSQQQIEKVAGSALAYRGVIFDLDGVVTDTARVHARVWKLLFDDYLQQRAARTGESFRPFDVVTDYRGFIDGKPRYDGVRSFLASRQIVLSHGAEDDTADRETVCGLGNRKDGMFATALERDGVQVFEGAVALARELGILGVRLALASSSRNSRAVLERAGLADLFAVRLDGVVAAERGLQGKPSPDIFLACAERLAVPPAECVVVEDAVAGVAAGRAGGFGLVIGIAHAGDEHTLFANGADIVVPGLNGIGPGEIDAWYRREQ